MKHLLLLAALTSPCLALADKPAPVYGAAAPPVATKRQDTYGSPQAPPAPTPDEYGSPKAPVVDEYGSPQAPPVTEDSYGAPAAPVVSQPDQAAPVGNQGYYYYYYPVKPNQGGYKQEDDGGLLDGLLGDGLIGGLITKKILLVVLGIGAFLLVTALGIQVNFGRSFGSSMYELATPYMTEDNLTYLADTVRRAIDKFQ